MKLEAHGTNGVRVRAIPTGSSFKDGEDIISALVGSSTIDSDCTLVLSGTEADTTVTSGNLIFANYGGSQAFDNDDGSSYYHTHSNVFYSSDGFKMCRLRPSPPPFSPCACCRDYGGSFRCLPCDLGCLLLRSILGC